MTGIGAVLVAIPARDEERRLPAALAAVRAAADHCPVPVLVVVAADACEDATSSIALAAGAALVEVDTGRVGAARAAAVRRGLELLDRPAAEVWIASTDADSQVPPEWLTVHLAAARTGVDALRGAVRPDARELAAEHLRRWLRLNPVRARHGYVHGANLGVRADAYLAVGGFGDLADDEDVALVRALEAAGRVVESTGAAPVVTSARLSGRTAHGFAGYLREHVVLAPEPVPPE